MGGGVASLGLGCEGGRGARGRSRGGGRDACARRHYHVTRHFLPLSLHLAKETVAKSPAVIPARPRSRTPQIADWNFGPTPLPTDLIPASVLYFPILGSCLYPAPCPCPLPLPLPLVTTTHPPWPDPPPHRLPHGKRSPRGSRLATTERRLLRQHRQLGLILRSYEAHVTIPRLPASSTGAQISSRDENEFLRDVRA